MGNKSKAEQKHVSGLTLHEDEVKPRHGRYSGQACVGAYDQPLEDFLFRKIRPHGLTWSEFVVDGVVRMADGSSILFVGNSQPAMPRGTAFEPDIFRRRAGENGFTRVPLRRGSHHTGSIGSGVIENGTVNYSTAGGVRMPVIGSETFELKLSPAELIFRQGEVINVKAPKLGLTWEYYVPSGPYYAQESFWEARGTILGVPIEYGFLFIHSAFTEFGTSLWEAYTTFAGFRGGQWVGDYCFAWGVNTYDTGERELLHLFHGLDDTTWVMVQASPAPGKPFVLTTVAREIDFKPQRGNDGSKQVLFRTARGEWEFVITASDHPESMWSWATGRRVGDTRKLTASAGWVDHILPSLNEMKNGFAGINIFGVASSAFRGGKAHPPSNDDNEPGA